MWFAYSSDVHLSRAGGPAYQNRPIFQSNTSSDLPAAGVHHSRDPILRVEQQRVSIAGASGGKPDEGEGGRFPNFQAAGFGFQAQGEGAVPDGCSHKKSRGARGTPTPQNQQ